MTSGSLTAQTAALEQAYADLRDLVPTGDALAAVSTDHLTALLYAHGWSRAVLQGAAALDAIHSAGLGAEAAPIRRLMIEHASLAEWLAKEPVDAVDVFDDASIFGLKKLRAAAMSAQMATSDETAHLDGYEPSGSTRMNWAPVGNLMTGLGLHGLKAAWLIETRLSHAGTATAARFVAADGDKAVLLEDVPDSMEDERRRSSFVKVLALDALLRAFSAVAPDLMLEDRRQTIVATVEPALSDQTGG